MSFRVGRIALAGVASLALACSLVVSLDDLRTPQPDGGPPAGTLGGPCFANDTCDNALVCVLVNARGVCELADSGADAVDGVADVDAGDAGLVLSVTLNGEQEVPSVSSSGVGGPATLALDEDAGTLEGTINFTGLTGTPTAAHLHVGACGSNGAILAVLTVNGTTNGSLSVNVTNLTTQQIAGLKTAQNYVNINTNTFASGEIRGQILPSGSTCP